MDFPLMEKARPKLSCCQGPFCSCEHPKPPVIHEHSTSVRRAPRTIFPEEQNSNPQNPDPCCQEGTCGSKNPQPHILHEHASRTLRRIPQLDGYDQETCKETCTAPKKDSCCAKETCSAPKKESCCAKDGSCAQESPCSAPKRDPCCAKGSSCSASKSTCGSAVKKDPSCAKETSGGASKKDPCCEQGSCGEKDDCPKLPEPKIMLDLEECSGPIVKGIFKVDGMTCAGCADTLDRHLGGLRGVSNRQISFVTSRLELDYHSDVLTEPEIISHIELLQFTVPHHP